MDLGTVSGAILLGVLLAYLMDKIGLPPFLGFFIAGVVVGRLVDLSFPGIYLQILLALVAFEVGRQLGSSGLSPVSFFAVLLETSLIMAISIVLLRLVGLTITEALIVGVAMLSSSSIMTLRLSQTLPEHARSVALSLTALEDAVLFFSLSLLLGGVTVETLPVNLTILFALSTAALAIFNYTYRFIVGREYALPFALAMAFSFVYIVQYFQLASPFIGAFIGGFLFSRTDRHKVHERETTALSGLIIYLYMLAVGLSFPAFSIHPLYLALGIAIALMAVFIRAVAVFFSSLLTTGQPKLSTGVALSTAHVSEVSLSIPIVAHTLSILSGEVVSALTISLLLTLFLAPLLSRYRTTVERYVAIYTRELHTTAIYEKLYKVVTHAFITSVKLAILTLLVALSIAYLGIYSLVAVAVAAYFLYKYSREVYRDLLIALGELRGARYTIAAIIASTFSLAAYVSFALLVRVAEIHFYVAIAVITVLAYVMVVIYRDLYRGSYPQREDISSFNSSTTTP
ncbi:MAG: cation:proton antiporter [Pyrobaculum sp.]